MLVDRCHVTRVQPPSLEDCCRRLRVPPVARHTVSPRTSTSPISPGVASTSSSPTRMTTTERPCPADAKRRSSIECTEPTSSSFGRALIVIGDFTLAVDLGQPRAKRSNARSMSGISMGAPPHTMESRRVDKSTSPAPPRAGAHRWCCEEGRARPSPDEREGLVGREPARPGITLMPRAHTWADANIPERGSSARSGAVRSPRAVRSTSTRCERLIAVRLRCVSIAPFGRPVVPDV